MVWTILNALVYSKLHMENKAIVEGFKGDNKRWEAPEAVVYVYIWLSPAIITSAFFLRWDIPNVVSQYMDLILLTALGIRGIVDGARIWKNGHSKEEPESKPIKNGE